MSPEPITLHDAIMALAADITNDPHLPDDVKLRWLDMLIVVSSAASGATIDAVESMSLAMTNTVNALDDFGDNDDDDDEEGDDFGDDTLGD